LKETKQANQISQMNKTNQMNRLFTVDQWARTVVHVHRNKSGQAGTVCFLEAVQANGPPTQTPEPSQTTV